MKDKIVDLIIIVLFAMFFVLCGYNLGHAAPDMTKHPRYAEISSKMQEVINIISAHKPSFSAYLHVPTGASNNYFSGTPLLPDIQPDGLSDLVVDTTIKQHNKAEVWFDFSHVVFKGTSTNVPFQITTDFYDLKEGRGFVIIFEVWFDGHWVYNYHEGPVPPNGMTIGEWYLEN